MSKVIKLDKQIEVESDEAMTFALLGFYVAKSETYSRDVSILFEIMLKDDHITLAELRYLRLKATQALNSLEGVAAMASKILHAAGEDLA